MLKSPSVGIASDILVLLYALHSYPYFVNFSSIEFVFIAESFRVIYFLLESIPYFTFVVYMLFVLDVLWILFTLM